MSKLTPLTRRGALLGAAALTLLTFVTTSGDATAAANTWTEIVLVLAAAGTLAALLSLGRSPAQLPPRARVRAVLSPLLFGALALLTALSLAWSIVPDVSWTEAGRTLSYLAVFTVAYVLARLAPHRTPAVVGAIGVSAAAICLWALAVKVFDLDLYGQPSYGRLLAPFQYWNATGLSGALALGPLIHLAVGRPRHRDPATLPGGVRIGAATQTALATAGISIAASVVVLSYSRSALAGALVAVLLPLCCIASRRRAVLVLVIGLLGAAPTAIYASADYTLSKDHNSIDGLGGPALHRTDPALLLGLITLLSLALVLLGTRAVIGRLDAASGPRLRRGFDLGCRVAIAAVPLAVVAFLLANARGPFGEISHLWNALTGTNAATGDNAGRLTSLNSSRSAYWHQAWAVGTHHLLAGTGAGSFDPAYLRYPAATLTPQGSGANHAHSYLLETFAVLGLLGVAVTVAQLGVWLADTRRAVSRRRVASGVERDARWALVATVIAYGVNSAIDWTWYFPGVVVPALVAAGWISGLAAQPADTPATGAAMPHDTRTRGVGEGAPGAAAPHRAGSRRVGPTSTAGAGPAHRRELSRRPGAILALTGTAVVAVALCWGVWQPLRSTGDISDALNAVAAGDGGAALADAHSAASTDPLSVAALQALASIDQATGHAAAGEAELVRATTLQPENPQPFAVLGSYLLCSGRYSAALGPLHRAAVLDVTDSYEQQQMITDADTRTTPSQSSTICGVGA